MKETINYVDYTLNIQSVAPEEVMAAGGADAYAELRPEKSLLNYFAFCAANPLPEKENMTFDEFLDLLKQLEETK